MSYDHVDKLIKDHKVEYVDLRFADMRGIEHHVTFPANIVDAALFEDGKMFDGSSIAGWKGINESDMVLLPDPATAYLDPFYADPTLVLTCDILDPATMQGYGRCPRGIAKRAEAFLKSSGIADQAFFGPEPEFFIFDSVRWANEMGHTFFHVDSEEAAFAAWSPQWSLRRDVDDVRVARVNRDLADVLRLLEPDALHADLHQADARRTGPAGA